MQTFDSRRTEFMPYGFTCGQWMPERMKRPDRHNEIELNLVLEGEIVYLFGGETVTLRSGQLGVFWASIPHQILSFDGNAPYFVATLPLPWFLAGGFPAGVVQHLLNGALLVESIAGRKRLDEELFRQWTKDLEQPDATRKQIARVEIEARLHRLAQDTELQRPMTGQKFTSSDFSEHKQKPTGLGTTSVEKVERMAYFIARNYTQRLTVEQIAQNVDLHPNYAMELFRKTLGTTLIDYIQHHRVTHAQRLLVTSDDSILEVALRSGFNSLSRFNVAFKARSGRTPSAYRRNHRLS